MCQFLFVNVAIIEMLLYYCTLKSTNTVLVNDFAKDYKKILVKQFTIVQSSSKQIGG